MKRLKEIFSGFTQKSEPVLAVESFSSCCGGGGHSHHHESRPETVYQCPMKCEGSKTYNAPGNCPVCNMHLAPVGQ